MMIVAALVSPVHLQLHSIAEVLIHHSPHVVVACFYIRTITLRCPLPGINQSASFQCGGTEHLIAFAVAFVL